MCEVANQTPEEVDRRRHAVMARFREIHKLQLQGKWDAETWDRFRKGELHNRSTTKEIHEEIAS
ncbi:MULTISPECIES: hypothetical protein [unclassified Bacillus (in: firmicutes)]|uniref:hypothetical protein n=1 Tax=unclassified Bacillus (in: firmicutes) TaxID=185979 RepID=UPI0030FB247E